ncbi:unnamed protein product [Hymenolepis diminuta]|uniref:Uncharacterized protein n=1 Tax=Hymenolepis diminuta TaxID=6216 RepID=A0A564Z4R0_HYMDI|nr:unnamed protein product [Hymenolepis diminuta]
MKDRSHKILQIQNHLKRTAMIILHNNHLRNGPDNQKLYEELPSIDFNSEREEKQQCLSKHAPAIHKGHSININNSKIFQANPTPCYFAGLGGQSNSLKSQTSSTQRPDITTL